jgi:Cytochrome P450
MPYTKNGALPAVFTTQDEQQHKQLKNPIAPLYALSNVVTFEGFVDEVLGVLFQQLDKRFVVSHDSFDLGDWIQYFAFDIMGTMTFSSRYGFLETGKDVDGMLQSIWSFMLTVAPVSSGQHSDLHIYPSESCHFGQFPQDAAGMKRDEQSAKCFARR